MDKKSRFKLAQGFGSYKAADKFIEELNKANALLKGASESAAGTQGIVPPPTQEDPNKFLRGDGTWAEAGGTWGSITGTLSEQTDLQSAIGAKLNAAQKGVANGVAELDSSGKVPSTQLPSYVDDVLEYANLAALPGTGETGKIYVTLDDNKCHRWTGSAYIEVSAGGGGSGGVNYLWLDRKANDSVRENIFVDVSSTSQIEDGTIQNPYKSLPAAFATISPLSANWARKVYVYVAAGSYGTLGSPQEIVVPGGRQINCLFMGSSSVLDSFVVHQNRSISYSVEPGNFLINGNVGATEANSGWYKEFSRTQVSYFSEPIYTVNDLTSGSSHNLNVQMANVEFAGRMFIAEPVGAVDSSASGAARFYGANFMSSGKVIFLWMANVTSRARDGVQSGGSTRSWNHIFGPSVKIMESKNCLIGNSVNVLGIARAVDTVFDGNVTVTQANNSDSTYDQPMKGFYRCKFKSQAGNVVVFSGPAGSFYADRLTLKYSNTATFSGGAGLGDAIGE